MEKVKEERERVQSEVEQKEEQVKNLQQELEDKGDTIQHREERITNVIKELNMQKPENEELREKMCELEVQLQKAESLAQPVKPWQKVVPQK